MWHPELPEMKADVVVVALPLKTVTSLNKEARLLKFHFWGQ